MASGDTDHIEVMEMGIKKADNAPVPSGSDDDGTYCLNLIIRC